MIQNCTQFSFNPFSSSWHSLATCIFQKILNEISSPDLYAFYCLHNPVASIFPCTPFNQAQFFFFFKSQVDCNISLLVIDLMYFLKYSSILIKIYFCQCSGYKALQVLGVTHITCPQCFQKYVICNTVTKGLYILHQNQENFQL